MFLFEHASSFIAVEPNFSAKDDLKGTPYQLADYLAS